MTADIIGLAGCFRCLQTTHKIFDDIADTDGLALCLGPTGDQNDRAVSDQVFNDFIGSTARADNNSRPQKGCRYEPLRELIRNGQAALEVI